MTGIKTVSSIDAANDAFLRTINSEVDLEVDFDNDAIDQIIDYGNRLKSCYERRIELERVKARRFVERTEQRLRASAVHESSKLPSPTAAPLTSEDTDSELFVGDVPTELPKILGDLTEYQKDPRLSCIHSRRFRCEIVCLFILDKLPEHKSEFISGIRVLREIVGNFKGCPNCKREYVRNVETRLAYLEVLYEDVFLHPFDKENAYSCTNMDSEAHAERYIKRIECDVQDLQCDIMALLAASKSVATTSEVISKAEETCGELYSALNDLAGALKNLNSSLKDP